MKYSIILTGLLVVLLASVAGSLDLKWTYGEAPSSGLDSLGIGYDRMLYGSSAALIDLPDVNSVGTDADDNLEVVIGSDEYCNPEDPSDSSQGVWRCLDSQGNLEWYRGTGTDESRSSPAVLDFYGDDGIPEIIGGTTSGWNVEAIDRFGSTFLWTFPSPLFLNGPYGWHSSPAVADLVPDVDGLEIAIGCNAYSHYGMWCFQADPSDGMDDGITSPGWSGYPSPPGGTDGVDWDVLWYYPTDCPVISTPCIVDMNDDGNYDVVFGVGWSDWTVGSDNGKIICLDGRNGSLLWEYNTGSDGVSASPSAADFDGDGDYEVVIGAYNGTLYFIDGDEDASGTIDPDEISTYSHGGRIYSSVAIGDVDGDSVFEVVAGIGNGYLKVFNYTPASGPSLEWYLDLGDSIISSPALAGDPDDNAPWPFFRHDIRRTGFYPHTGNVLHIFIGANEDSTGYLYDITGDAAIVDQERIGTKVHTSPVVADLDGDCILDLVITGSNTSYDSLWMWETEGPDTIFCFGTDITVHGCEMTEFNPHIAEVYTESCSLVYAIVCVYDEDSNYVRGLGITNFGFTENGIPIVPPNLELINECPPETTMVDVVLLFDFSTSMDDEVDTLYHHVPEFVDALEGVDYQIAILVFNGCPAEPDGVCEYVRTSFTGPSACDLDLAAGPDWWASDSTEFACLFEAAMDMYTWPASARGSGYEDQYGAIIRANSIIPGFRSGAQKVFVLLTDERPIVNDTYCLPAWGETPSVTMQYPPDSIINYCREESIIVIPVTPPDSQFAYAWFEPPARAYYDGYYDVGDSTGGKWFNLYSDDWSELVTAIGEEISVDSCCYQFVWRETLFCTDTVHLEVSVFDASSGAFGTDDTVYDALCPPTLELTMPIHCGGITSCDGQGFVYNFVNPEDGALVPSSLVLIVNDDTLGASDSGVVVSDGGISYFPPESWEHGDTVTFWIDHIENVNGCASSTGPCTFVVDIVPPEVLNPSPAPGETLASPEDVVISARLFDDFSGVDTSVFSEENVVITLGPDTIPYDSLHFEDSLTFTIYGLDIASDGHYTVCVNNLDDSPDYDYCPPNHLEQFCWDFFIVSIERYVWFGDTCQTPCDTAYVPLYIDSLVGTNYNSVDVWFHCDFELLHPERLEDDGTIAPIGDFQLEEVIPDSLWHLRIVWSDTLTDMDGGIIVYLLALTGCNARGGDFTPVIIDSARINDGYPRVTWGDGFFYALWQIWPWLNDIIITRAGDTLYRAVAIGANSAASEGYDPTQDLLYIEPPPSEVDAYITLHDDDYPAVEKLKRSVQGYDLPDRWVIKTDTETLAVVHWNPDALPEGRVEMNGVVNMKIDTMYLWRVADMESLVIEWYLPDLRRCDMPLDSGWNLISLPRVTTHHSCADVFPGAIGAWGYDGSTGAYYFADQFQQGFGYWIFLFHDTTYTFAGTPVERYDRLGYSGWNLIGAGIDTISVSNICTSPGGLLLTPLYGYNGASYYNESSHLIPGKGYWALLLGDAVISVPGGGMFCRAAAKTTPDWEATISAELDDEVEILKFGIGKHSANGLDGADEVFPPALPDGEKLNSIRFRRDIFNLKRDISSDEEWWLELDKPAQLSFSIPAEMNFIITAISGEMFEISDERTISLNAGMYKISSPELANVPALALMPNHPNPFNLTTKITFSLPKREKIQLAVIDVMGRNVATLIEDEMEPGFHSVMWNAKNSPSGIYFIKLSTPSGSATTRTMLVK
ncbi:T9SS type A sorting domain-containing protein [bacterium]|nr:T9SS type A sorting domain-containing protein [bacterium]